MPAEKRFKAQSVSRGSAGGSLPALEADVPSNARRFWLLVLLIVVFAGVLRVHFLARTQDAPLWLDEFFSVHWSNGYSSGVGISREMLPVDKPIIAPPEVTSLAAARPIWSIWSSLKTDVQGPVYYTILRLWRMTFGSTDTSMQVLSILCSVGGVAALILAARRIVGAGAALWAGLMMAAAPVQLVYSREIRPYAMVSLLVLLTLWVITVIRERGARPWLLVLAGAGFLLSMLTHYYCVGALAAMFVWGLVVIRGKDRWRFALAVVIAGAVFLALWGPSLLAQWRYAKDSGSANWMQSSLGDPFFATHARLAAAPLQLMVHFTRLDQEGLRLGLAVVLTGLIFAATVRLLWRRDLWLFWAWLWAVIGMVAVLDVRMNTFQLEIPRLIFVAAPALYVLVAGLASPSIKRWWSHLVPLMVVMGLLVMCWSGLPNAQMEGRLNYPFVARVLDQEASAEAPVVLFCPSRLWPPQYSYLGVTYYLHHPRSSMVMLDGSSVAPETLAFLRRSPTVWYVQIFGGTRTRFALPGFTPVERYLVEDTGVMSKCIRDDTIPREGIRAHTYVVTPDEFVEVQSLK